jgi:hypothetical protein
MYPDEIAVESLHDRDDITQVKSTHFDNSQSHNIHGSPLDAPMAGVRSSSPGPNALDWPT